MYLFSAISLSNTTLFFTQKMANPGATRYNAYRYG